MPVKPVRPCDFIPGRPCGRPPDVRPDDHFDGDLRVMIRMEEPFCLPADFDKLPKAEQQRLMDKYRFNGIRLRSDIHDQSVPISRKTLDI